MSGASIMRNAVKRIAHKERIQPSDRKRLGLLEKHKDYVVRAKDYNRKKAQINALKVKANEKNPDEFYFNMNRSQVSDGKHQKIKRGADNVSDSVVKLLKSQDMGYIVMKKATDESKIRRLKENMHMSAGKRKQPKCHRIFMNDDDQSIPSVDDKATTMNKVALSNTESGNDNLQNKMRHQTASLRELKERTKRVRRLKLAMEQLALQRNLCNSKGSKKKIVLNKDEILSEDDKDRKSRKHSLSSSSTSSDEKVVYKWKRQRAR